MKKEVSILIITAILLLPIISAYSWGYYNSPLMYLDNEWVMFTIILLVSFALIFHTTNKAFNNQAVSAVIAGSISLLITITVLKRGLLYGYLGDEIGSWVLIAAGLVLLGFLIKLSYETFGAVGSTIAVFFAWLLLQRADAYSIIPYGAPYSIVQAYEFITSIFGLIILVAIAIFASPFMEGETKGQKFMKKILKNLGLK